MCPAGGAADNLVSSSTAGHRASNWRGKQKQRQGWLCNWINHIKKKKTSIRFGRQVKTVTIVLSPVSAPPYLKTKLTSLHFAVETVLKTKLISKTLPRTFSRQSSQHALHPPRTRRRSRPRSDDPPQRSRTDCTANIHTKSVSLCNCACVLSLYKMNGGTNRSWGPAHLLLHQSSQDWEQLPRAARYAVSPQPLLNRCGNTVPLLGYQHFWCTLRAFFLLTLAFSSLCVSVATVSVPCCTVQRVELLLLFQKCVTNSL